MHDSHPTSPTQPSATASAHEQDTDLSQATAAENCQLWIDTPPTAAGEPRPVAVQPATHAAPQENRLGDILVRSGRLTTEDIQRIVAYQQGHSLRFGEAAIAMGLLTAQDLQNAVSQQYRYPTATNDSELGQFAIASAPFGDAAESIRRLRTEIMQRHNGQRPLSIAIISPNDGEGKTYLSASLALAFAQNGYRTLLINADLRSPEKGSLLGTKTTTGLSAILAGRGIGGYTQPVSSFPLLHTLDAGPRPPNPTEILREPMLKDMIETLRGSFDVFIVDTPSAKHYPDAQIIARQVDTAVLVTRQHLTRLNDLDQVQDSLRGAAVPITGVVYNSHPTHDTHTALPFLGPVRRWLQKLRR